MEIYEMQHDGRRVLIHRHLVSATDWEEPCVVHLTGFGGFIVAGRTCVVDG